MAVQDWIRVIPCLIESSPRGSGAFAGDCAELRRMFNLSGDPESGIAPGLPSKATIASARLFIVRRHLLTELVSPAALCSSKQAFWKLTLILTLVICPVDIL